jgi:hypothetical protein
MGRNSKTLWIVDQGSIGNLSQPFDQLVGENVDTSPKVLLRESETLELRDFGL